MAETAKAYERRKAQGFFERYITGRGLDIGAGDDPLTADCDIFEKIEDNPNGFPNGRPPETHTIYRGDAHILNGINHTYDWVYASHVLEHMENPVRAIQRWFEVVKPGGYLIVSVPHRDLYEKRTTLPSHWNGDHKCFWLPYTNEPPVTWGFHPFLEWNLKDSLLEHFEVCDAGHSITDPMLHSDGEYQIEAIIRKKPAPQEAVV